jgi:hypothetical protein
MDAQSKIMDSLPRDMQLLILQKTDIDARRALGIFFKLRVPDTLKHSLEKVIQPPAHCNLKYCTRSAVNVGRYRLLRTLYPTHMESHVIHEYIDMEDGEEIVVYREMLWSPTEGWVG